MNSPREVFLTGATGFMGSRLAAELLRRGHRVRALARPGSEARVPAGCEVVHGDALRYETYAVRVAPADTFVHLIGVAHPNPRKATEFRDIDLKSCQEAVRAATEAGVCHLVYLSVARPAPVMREYQAVRAEGERLIRESGMAATFVRPWYVLGPGRRWPRLLVPMYALVRLVPATRDGAQRLGLVTVEQMTQTLAWAVENPPEEIRILEPPQIRRGFGEPAPAMREAASA
jgi:nucleoside-diphosphate-sugar epimerase